MLDLIRSAALASILVATPLLAQHGPGAGPPTFEEFDLDGDGQLGEAEFYEARGQRIAERAAEGRQMKHLSEAPSFSEIDADGNGSIDSAEFASHQAHHRARHGGQKAPDVPEDAN
jgi:hypothetical protein